jgi:alpha-D-ribose 1-methylphosphonate 5-triphosphate synthase subunit PhnL
MSVAAIRVQGLSKKFVLHNQGGAELPVLEHVDLEVAPGECVVLDGPSGSGKSTLLKCLYANYRANSGTVHVRNGETETELGSATPRELLRLRRDTVGYVSQFLRAIPRVPALDIVAEPLVDDAGEDPEKVREAVRLAKNLLLRLRIPQRLWFVPPATFSGGEQQRINIARSLIKPRPILLLDEPTASLDADNRVTVVSLINEARERGAAIVGIFHDARVRDSVATHVVNMTRPL